MTETIATTLLTKDEVMLLAEETAGNYWMDEAHIQRFARRLIEITVNKHVAGRNYNWYYTDVVDSSCLEFDQTFYP